jgi:DNA invertase Pin-like site-specific DNA recombinase
MEHSLLAYWRSLLEQNMEWTKAARARGRNGGRPKRLTKKQIEMLQHLTVDKKHSVKEICLTLGIGRTAFYRYIKPEQSGHSF